MRTILDEFITTFRYQSVGAQTVGKEIDDLTKKLEATTAKFNAMAFLWATGFITTAHSAAKFEDSLIATATQARISTGEMWEHYEVLKAIADQSGLTYETMLKGTEELVEQTGKIKFAIDNAKLLADVMKGAQMKPKQAAELISTFHKLFDVSDTTEIRAAIDDLTYVAKAGSLPIGKMGDILPRMFASVKASGVDKLRDAAREVGIVSQLINAITIKSSVTGTAFENLILDYSTKIDSINELTGKNFTGREGPLTIVQAIVDAYKDDQQAGQISDILGMQIRSVDDARNELAKASDHFNRRALRAFAGVFHGQRLKGELEAEWSKAPGTLARDAEKYADSVGNYVASLSNAAKQMQELIVKSGALQAGLGLLDTTLRSIVGIFKLIPDWVLQVATLFFVWNKIIYAGLIQNIIKLGSHLGWLAQAIWGVTGATAAQTIELRANTIATAMNAKWTSWLAAVEIWKMRISAHGIATLGASTLATWLHIAALKVLTVVTKAMAAAQLFLNTAMKANPIGFVLSVIIGSLLLIVSLFKWIKKWWNEKWGKKNLSVGTRTSDEAYAGYPTDPEVSNMVANLSGGGDMGAMPVSQTVASGGGSRTTNVTNLHVDARGASNPQLVKTAVREAFTAEYGRLFHENRTAEVPA